MYQFIPIPIEEHNNILGASFANTFALIVEELLVPLRKYGFKEEFNKQLWEEIVAISIPGATWCGAGNNVVDVKTPIADLDVKGLSAKTTASISTEASYMQNLKQVNNNFMESVNNGDFADLFAKFVAPLDVKLKDTNNLHIFALLRIDGSIYYALLKVEKSELSEEEFIKLMHMKSNGAIYVPMIADKNGVTTFNIAKRRLELRLNCKGLLPYMVKAI